MKNTLIAIFIIGAAGLCLQACKKNSLQIPYDYVSGANLKINYALLYKSNPAVQLKINDQRVSSNITATYPFPGGGLNTNGGGQPDYFVVTPGNIKIAVSIPKAGSNEDSVSLFTTSVTLSAGKFYTTHLFDTANTQSLLTEDNVTSPDSGFSKFKFVNLIPNVAALDLYFGTKLVVSNIAYKGSSGLFTIANATADKWVARVAGSAPASAAIATYPASTNFTVTNQRVMTVFARGYNGVTGSTDPRTPQISLIYVR